MQNLRAAGNQQVHRYIFYARNMPDQPRYGVLTALRDTSDLIFTHIIEDIIFKRPGLSLSHRDRVQTGVLAQKHLYGFVVQTGIQKDRAQRRLLLEA